jgi:hypothetical protein
MRRERRLSMRGVITALLLGALSGVPVAGFAATQSVQSTAAPAKHASKPAAATHATRGVVKSIDDKTLVVTQSGGKHAEMTFALNASTHRAGTIAAGTAVSIRYREEGKTNVATAIRVESAKQPAAHTTPSKR